MASDKDRKITESLLNSLLISSKTGVPLHKLAREYKETTFSEIPLQKLGYASLEQYIKSIPHCARIEIIAGGLPIVKGVANESNKHIAKLVSGQRKTKKTPAIRKPPPKFNATRNRGLRPMGIHVVRRPGGSPMAQRPNVAVVAPRFLQQQAAQPVSMVKRSFANKQFDNRPQRTNHSGSHAQTTNQSGYQLPPRMQRNQQNSNLPVNSAVGRNQDLRQKLERQREAESSQYPAGVQNLKFTVKNYGSQSEHGDIAELKSNVVKFLEGYPNGIWQQIFEKLFKKRFGKAPPDLVDIISAQMSDKVDVTWAYAGKAIITLKKEPVVTRKQLEPERPQSTMSQDTRVVVVKEQSLDIQVQIGKHSNNVPAEEEEEEVSIAEQELPGIGERFDVFVCHVDSVHRFFVHRADSEILDLSQNIQKYCQENSNADAIKKPKIGNICCAYYIDQWYRARIIFTKAAETGNNLSNGNALCQDVPKLTAKKRYESLPIVYNKSLAFDCKVLFVDYGNMEFARSDMIRKLKPEFCTLPAQAIQCRLHGVAPKGEQSDWDEETISYFTKLTGEPLTIHIVDCRDQIIEVELFTCHGQNIAEVLADNGYAYYKGRRRKETTEGYDEKPEGDDEKPEGDDEEASSKPRPGILQRLTSLSIVNDEEIEVAKVELPKTESIKILVSVVNSLTEISAILLGHDNKDRLTILEAGMQAYYDAEHTEMMETVDKDCLYAAFFEEAWYRAKVTDVRGDEAEIYFVDLGDNGQVKTSELRKLPAQFKRLPMQAIDLTLDHLPDTDDADCIRALSEMILGKEFEAEIVESTSDYTMVQLFDTSAEESVSINEKIAAQLDLKEEGDFEPMLPKANEQCDAIVFYISDSGTFNVVLSSSGLNSLVEMIDELSKGANDSNVISNPEQDQVALLRLKEDEEYVRRVKVTRILQDEMKVEVEFMDEGDYDVVPISALREFPEHLKELKTLPNQTVKCKLADCPEEAEDLWKDGLAAQLIIELRTQPVVIKVVKEQTDDNVAEVEIFKADTVDSSKFSSIAEDIISICTNMRQNRGQTVMDVAESTILESEDNDPFSSAETATQMFSSNSVDFTTDNSNYSHKENTVGFGERQLSLSSSSSDLIGTTNGLVIRDVTLPPLRINDNWLVVHVTWVTSPSSFYFQLHEYVPLLISLMEDMNQFYKDSKMVFDSCQVGDMCAVFVPEDDSWYRGIVRSLVEIDEEYKVAVFLADFGGNIFCDSTELRKLDEKFHSLPLQAIKGSLADVHPPQGKWPATVCKEFINQALHCLFYAKFCVPEATYPMHFFLPSSKRIDVRLYDTSGDVDVVVNETISSSVES